MSRTNPYKKKRRVAKTTVLIYGEGQSEEMFLKHLRKLYGYDSGKAITIKRGKGGTPQGIVQGAINCPGDYKKRVVVLDNDKTKSEMRSARMKADSSDVIIIENTPCLEKLLLCILEEGRDFEGKTSSQCKKLFEDGYISKKQRAEGYRYSQVFTKKLLDKRRRSLLTLDCLLKEIE
ncbi:MAG: RloB domain-containing protein [Candidatus Peregrinibacteria bacterium]